MEKIADFFIRFFQSKRIDNILNNVLFISALYFFVIIVLIIFYSK